MTYQPEAVAGTYNSTARVAVDKRYVQSMPADVELGLPGLTGDSAALFSPRQARYLAEALIRAADEADRLNKEHGR